MSAAGAHVSATGTSCSRLRSRAMASTSMTSVGVRTSLSVTIATAKLVRHSMRGRTRFSRRAPCWRGVPASRGMSPADLQRTC